MSKASLLTAAILAGALAGQAQASTLASASSSISGLTYRLIDLDTTDGITPSIQFTNNSVIAGTGFSWGNQIQTGAGTVFAPPSITLTDNGLSASTSGFQTSAELANSEIANAPLRDPATYNGWFSKFGVVQSAFGTDTDIELGTPTPFPDEFSLTLSANTALVVEGVFNISNQLDATQLAQGSVLQGIQNGEYTTTFSSGAIGYMELYSVEDLGAGPLALLKDSAQAESWLQQTLGANGLESSSGTGGSFQQAFSIQLSNLTSAQYNGVLKLFVGSQMGLQLQDTVVVVPEVPEVPAIPEPGTWALMGLGLGLMAWRVKATRA